MSTGDWFGAAAATGYSGSTRGTLYHDLTVTWPATDSLSLGGHVGRTDVKARYAGVDPDSTDWRVALTKTLAGGWSAGAALAGANNDRYWRPPVGGLSLANGDARAVNRTAFIVALPARSDVRAGATNAARLSGAATPRAARPPAAARPRTCRRRGR